jgi:hypothetical protein
LVNHKIRATLNFKLNQLYAPGGGDFSGIQERERPQDFREFILQTTLHSTFDEY